MDVTADETTLQKIPNDTQINDNILPYGRQK